jgi:hypothetical protein
MLAVAIIHYFRFNTQFYYGLSALHRFSALHQHSRIYHRNFLYLSLYLKTHRDLQLMQFLSSQCAQELSYRALIGTGWMLPSLPKNRLDPTRQLHPGGTPLEC